MREMTVEEMEMVEGGRINWENVLCNGYFIGMAAVIGSGTVVGGVVVSVLGAAVCSLT